MQVGIIASAGRSGIAELLHRAGIEVVVCAVPLGEGGGEEPDRTTYGPAGSKAVEAYAGFLEALEYPRRYVLDLPPGPGIDTVIDEAYQTMEPGDVVIDATGSYWGDTLRRYRRMRHRSLFYQDVAWLAADEERQLLVAGDAKGLPLSHDILAAWAAPGKLRAVAGAGFAHYLAMVEAAAALARDQVACEQAQLIEAYPGEVSPEDKASFLPSRKAVPTVGRAGWLLDDAVRLEAAVPFFAQAVMQRIAEALEAHASSPPPPRGAFVHPDDIL